MNYKYSLQTAEDVPEIIRLGVKQKFELWGWKDFLKYSPLADNKLMNLKLRSQIESKEKFMFYYLVKYEDEIDAFSKY
jgi:hypothetical protein